MNTSTTSGAMYSAEPHWDSEEGASSITYFCTLYLHWSGSGGAGGYRCGELRGRYGRAGAAQLHSAAQVEITDLHWGDLVDAEWGRALVRTSHSGPSEVPNGC